MNTPDKENQSSYFREQMKKAFYHGRNFKQKNNPQGDDTAEDTPDENLPFAEWFSKHYANLDENYGYFKIENGCPVK